MPAVHGLLDFIHASPTPFHCVAEGARRLREAGALPLDQGAEPEALQPGHLGYLVQGGTLIAWRMGTAPPAEAGFRLLGAHTDSPNLRLKPRAERPVGGYLRWGVEVYGGAIVSTWADRDLGLSGRVAVRGEADRIELHLVRVDRPIARIPTLAIHLDRKVNERGLLLDKQKDLPPTVALVPAGEGEGPGALDGLLAAELGCAPGDLLAWDLGLHDLQPPVLGGLSEDFVFASRLDDQASCFCALQAFLRAGSPGPTTSVIALFDHEECGSQSARGAESALLGRVLSRLERDAADRAPGGLERAAANSFMASADMAHGVHPAHADRHDPDHKPRLNGGPVIKTNVNMRYASDAPTAARFRRACETAGVPVQHFVNRSDLACGTTIGPITAARLGIPAVDVGCAMLSMHSVREQAGAADVGPMILAMTEVLRGS